MFRQTESAAWCFAACVLLTLAYPVVAGVVWLVRHPNGLTLWLLWGVLVLWWLELPYRRRVAFARQRSRQASHELAIERGLTAQAIDTAIELRRQPPRLMCLPTRCALCDEPGECDPCGRF